MEDLSQTSPGVVVTVAVSLFRNNDNIFSLLAVRDKCLVVNDHNAQDVDKTLSFAGPRHVNEQSRSVRSGRQVVRTR